MRIIDIINRTQQAGGCRFTFELLPPLKGDGTEAIFDAIDTLMPFDPAYINVTFHREDTKYAERPDGFLEKRIVRHRPGTVGISAAIMRRYGVEVVPHIICGGLSVYDIEDSLIDMDFLGVNNVLVLRGDCKKDEQRFSPHPQGHHHACDLVRQVDEMNRGIFIDREEESLHRSNFCIGVAGYPEKHAEAPNIDADIENLKRKIDAGAEYIVTQMSFDSEKILSFIDACRAVGITVPIIPGIKPITTKAHLTVLPQTFHVDLPQELVRAVESCSDNSQVREVGIEWATMQVHELKKAGLAVIHFYTMGKTDNIARIVKQLF